MKRNRVPGGGSNYSKTKRVKAYKAHVGQPTNYSLVQVIKVCTHKKLHAWTKVNTKRNANERKKVAIS